MSASTGRRQLFGAAAAAVLVASVPMASAEAQGADNELLEAYEGWLPWEEERLQICALEPADPRFDLLFDDNADGWHEWLAEVMEAPPARSPEGMRAKAYVLKALLENHMRYGFGAPTHGEKRDDLAYSLVIDMLRSA